MNRPRFEVGFLDGFADVGLGVMAGKAAIGLADVGLVVTTGLTVVGLDVRGLLVVGFFVTTEGTHAPTVSEFPENGHHK